MCKLCISEQETPSVFMKPEHVQKGAWKAGCQRHQHMVVLLLQRQRQRARAQSGGKKYSCTFTSLVL